MYAKSSSQMLSVKEEFNLHSLNFLIIGLYNSSTNFGLTWFYF